MSISDNHRHIAYYDLAGSGSNLPPLVMLHGLGASATTSFLDIAHRLEPGHYRRIAIDLPGFGSSLADADWNASIESHADSVATVLDKLGVSAVSLVGHSMGGSIAIALASRRPDLVGRLIVAEPNLDPGTGDFSGKITRYAESAFLATGREAILRALRIDAANGDKIAAIFGSSVAQALPTVLYRSAVSLRADRSPTFREQLLALHVPRLYIAGETSREIIADEITPHGIEFAEIAGAGHVMMTDDPGAFTRIVQTFLDLPR